MGVQREAGAPGELFHHEAAAPVLDKIGYGARPGDVDRVMKTGVNAHLEAQLAPAGLVSRAESSSWISWPGPGTRFALPTLERL